MRAFAAAVVLLAIVVPAQTQTLEAARSKLGGTSVGYAFTACVSDGTTSFKLQPLFEAFRAGLVSLVPYAGTVKLATGILGKPQITESIADVARSTSEGLVPLLGYVLQLGDIALGISRARVSACAVCAQALLEGGARHETWELSISGWKRSKSGTNPGFQGQGADNNLMDALALSLDQWTGMKTNEGPMCGVNPDAFDSDPTDINGIVDELLMALLGQTRFQSVRKQLWQYLAISYESYYTAEGPEGMHHLTIFEELDADVRHLTTDVETLLSEDGAVLEEEETLAAAKTAGTLKDDAFSKGVAMKMFMDEHQGDFMAFWRAHTGGGAGQDPCTKAQLAAMFGAMGQSGSIAYTYWRSSSRTSLAIFKEIFVRGTKDIKDSRFKAKYLDAFRDEEAPEGVAYIRENADGSEMLNIKGPAGCEWTPCG